MDIYHCMIDLKSDAKALAFAAALDQWLGRLAQDNRIGSWRLMRRKLGLASGAHADFVLQIEVTDMTALEALFHATGQADDTDVRIYDFLHGMIATQSMGLYRDFPDPERRERIALI